MAKLSTYNEAEALRLLIAGDPKGFKQIYDKYALNIMRLGRSYFHSTELADDLVQEVFAAVWKQRERFADVEYFQRYLFRMVKQIAYRHLDTIANRELGEREYAKLRRFEENSSADSYLLDKECKQMMEKAVEELPSTHRQVYELVTNDGLTNKAVAEKLNVSIQTVYNSLALTLKSIKQHLGLHIITLMMLAI